MIITAEPLGFKLYQADLYIGQSGSAKAGNLQTRVLRGKKKLLRYENDRILFEDESMIRDYQALANTWFPVGRQKVIPTYGKHHGVKLLGTLDYESGEIFCIEEEQYDAQVYLSFLEKITSKYVGEKIVMILDNDRIHHAKLIQPFLEAQKGNLQLLFLPPYSPQLNIIEGLWAWVKKSVIYNVFFASVNEIRAAVQAFIKEIHKQPLRIIDRDCICDKYHNLYCIYIDKIKRGEGEQKQSQMNKNKPRKLQTKWLMWQIEL